MGKNLHSGSVWVLPNMCRVEKPVFFLKRPTHRFLLAFGLNSGFLEKAQLHGFGGFCEF